MKKSLLSMVLLLLSMVASAHDFEVDGFYYNIINGNEVAVTYKGSDPYGNDDKYTGDVSIPSFVTYNSTTYSVTSIGDYAFRSCSELTSIVIPNSVTSIGRHAFYSCSGLTSIVIPNSVTSIEWYAFYSCRGLTSIELGNSVTSIGMDAFSNCSRLTSIVIPNSVTSIGNNAFGGCSDLTSIVIPNSVTSIGDGAFYSCSGLTSISVESGNTIYDSRDNCNAIIETSSNTLIAGCKRDNCNAIIETSSNTLIAGCKNTIIPNSVTSIGGYAFYSCSGLTSIELGNSVTSIGIYAFCQCRGLTSIVIPNSVTNIGNEAFNGCSGLTSIVIPNSVTSIGYGAFGSCSGLTSISVESGNTIYDSRDNCNAIIETSSNTLIAGCKSIDNYAFSSCSGLTNIYCYSQTPPTCFDGTFDTYSATLHVPASSLAAYFTASYWSNFENIIGDAVAPTGISISNDSINLQPDEQMRLIATVTPQNASNKEITWISTDTSVATVDNGVVYAVDCGECDIIASCFGMQAVCHVSVAIRITLDQQEAMLLPNHILSLTPMPTVPGFYAVSSSDPTVAAARVLSSGIVQVVGIKEGTTTITVGSVDGTAIPATCLVTVYTEPGDMNSDGFVNISDVTSLIDYLLSDDSSQLSTKNADVNGDGHINISDVTALIDALLHDE